MTLQTNPATVDSLGADLRALRKARGMTLQGMADALGRSVGWLSQVERDLSEPSITDLRHIAATLDIAMSTLFRRGAAPAEEEGYVVRSGARRPIGSRTAGLVEELLSPDLTDDFEMVHSTFQPHSQITDPVTRPTQDVGYLISGQLDLDIAGRRFTIGPGDSFRIRGEPFRWLNPYDAPAVAIWVIAPPVY
jgi:transcriptional regulator with XRE-family HTH domain